MTPVFFTSRSCGDERAYVERFHADLEQAVAARLSQGGGARGVLPSCTDPGAGAPREALACSVPAAVVLASPDYLADPRAMREWAVLAERVRGHRAHTGRQADAVVTLRWRATDSGLHGQPVPDSGLPGQPVPDSRLHGQPVPDFGAENDYGPIYARQGLFDLMRLEGHSADYRHLVARLARVLVAAERAPLRPLPAAEARELFPTLRVEPGPPPARTAFGVPAPFATAFRGLPARARAGLDSAARPRWITARHNPRRPLLWGPGGEVEEH
ncbi:hypothetical protein B4N89_05620 [Embleya scabrispora]|uniref:TIR domain-containing protein n=1 Tax=Embleya scabrispora TaxID=159449 RepID=A0A1T3NUN2_9ACTN|nr:hypothetical protein [Embleya scabrispora]OPC80498.1 hypothetical protein B4N89_05620 [Embleya scabrispora]